MLGRQAGSLESERQSTNKFYAETFQKAHFTRSKKKEVETIINKSAISNHVAQENHTIEWKKIKILSKDSNKFTRWISKKGGRSWAVHIQQGQERSMNRDMG